MKTFKTIELEKKLFNTFSDVYSCFEVTIGFLGKERVDFITYDSNDIFRCFEIKVSKQDFNSNAKKSFVGNFNYYVMPHELYEELKEQIPSEIGVYTDDEKYWNKRQLTCVKNAKKQELKCNSNILKNSLIRSLSREANKLQKIKELI